ncbi:MAG: TlpA disulfide reductase family protein [Gilvibacter sp.]
MRLFFAIILSFLSLSCSDTSKTLKPGIWRATLEVRDGQKLPFNVMVEQDKMTVQNAQERVTISDIQINGDSIVLRHPIFEGVFKGTFTEEAITGTWSKPSLGRVLPFTMTYGDAERFKNTTPSKQTVDGVWEMVFSPDIEDDRYIAKGIFSQKGDRVTGNIQTTTGDYRFLEGTVTGDSLKLSTFDGAHAFLFVAKVTDTALNGIFYSDSHWKEPFVGTPNSDYELPDPSSLTYMNEGYDRLAFSFPDADGNQVSLDDDIFKDKVVVVQIMGTWCPNCLDESKYFSSYVKESAPEDVQFVALAFEYAPTQEKALSGIKRLKQRLELPYPVLLAQFGTSDKKEANKKLPMLNHVLSYPTTIVIDKQGEIQKIHTGFNGPATGEKYELFKTEFEGLLKQLSAD